MSRAGSLAKALRDLKEELSEVSERKSAYDHDANRAVVALGRFNKIVQRENHKKQNVSLEENHPQRSSDQNPSEASDKIDDLVNEEAEKSAAPAWAKKAFRLIAIRTHPDKVNVDENLTDAQRDRLIALYGEASSAYQSGSYDVLSEIAAELEITIDIPEIDLERALESKIKSIRSEIQTIQKSVSWVWGTSFGDLPTRVSILRFCCGILKISVPEDSVLEEIIRELEAQPDFDIVDRLGRVKRIKAGVERRKPGERPMKRIR